MAKAGNLEQSRNAWINKGEPTTEFSGVFKEGYVDILEDTRHSSDFNYSMRKRHNVPAYKHTIPRKPSDIKQHVLASERVRYALQKTCEELKKPESEVMAEAVAILDDMMHNLNLGAVRFFAYFLVKVFRSLFRRVYVNMEGIDRLRKLISQYPVVLMPTHRSYMDFLLASFIMYHHDLPLPVIAAAMDFQGMKFFGWLLRNCGAFYIRRSFGTDVLYWALFTEYVQTHIRNGDAPIEFFVEGTRSRTSKSYTPKIGMLSASLESYFKAEVADVMIVPISISYDRILEEGLYSYELLGIPKPKESTSGLLKARSVLSEDFGSVHIFFDEPISLRLFSVGHVDRTLHCLEPRYINRTTKEERKLSERLAYHVVRRHQQHAEISPWSLMAAVLMQSPEGITVKQLAREVDWLKRLASNLSAKIDWPGNKSAEEVFQYHLQLHASALDVQDDVIKLKAAKPVTAGLQKEDVMTVSAGHILLSLYRNQLLHVFVRVGLVALGVNGCQQETLSLGDLFKRYSFLESLLRKEFIFVAGETRQDFEQAVQTLTHSGGLCIENDQVLIRRSICKHTTFLSQMFEPFLAGYWVLCQYLLTLTSDVNGRPLSKKQPVLARDAQQLAVRLLQENVVKHYEILSLDIISNGLTVLGDLGALYRDKRNEQTWLSPNSVAVSNVAAEITKYIEVPNVCIANFVSGKNVGAVAKL